MAKTMTFTQNDSGMIITVSISDGKKQPLKIKHNTKIIGHLKKPDGSCIDIDSDYITITDREKTTVRLTIAPSFTAEEGFYQIYLSVVDTAYSISTTKTIDYYVLSRHSIGEH